MLALISIYGKRHSTYGYIWIRQYGNVLYMWASMKFLPAELYFEQPFLGSIR